MFKLFNIKNSNGKYSILESLNKSILGNISEEDKCEIQNLIIFIKDWELKIALNI